MKGERIVVRPDGSANRVGIVTPEGTRLHVENRTHFVLYVPGHTYWADRMTGSKYAPAEYVVYVKTQDTASGSDTSNRFLYGDTVIDIPVRRSKSSD